MTEPRIPSTRPLPDSWLRSYEAYLVHEVAAQLALERRRRWRLLLALAPAVVVLLVATAFTTYRLTREPTHFETLGCYERASLRANTAIVEADGRDPTSICAELWRRGDLGDLRAPPKLAACVLESGAIGVFPSARADACTELGLAALPPTYAAEGRRFAALREAIFAELGEPASGSSRGSAKCVAEADARTIVRRALDAHGYGSWQVEVAGDGFNAARPCAEVSFDGKREVVLIVPAPRRGTEG